MDSSRSGRWGLVGARYIYSDWQVLRQQQSNEREKHNLARSEGQWPPVQLERANVPAARPDSAMDPHRSINRLHRIGAGNEWRIPCLYKLL